MGDDSADDSHALQAAFDALAAAGGGTLNVPEGRYRLASPVSKNFLNQASVIIRGHGSATVFHIASGSGTTNISVLGAESLLVENLTFAGTPGVATDARVAFNVGSVERTTFRRTEWYGVGSAEGGGAVLRATLTSLLVENSSFRGCATSYWNSVPVVHVADWFGTKFTGTDFIDYGTLHGVYHSKTPQGTRTWIHLTNPHAEKEARAIFSHMFLDEGATIGIHTQTETPAIVSFDHIGANVNNTSVGVGLRIVGARHASVSHSYLGFASHDPRNAIEFSNVGTAVVDQTELRDKANRVWADDATKSLTVSRSTVETLDAAAAAITLEDSDIAVLQLAPASKVTTRSGGKLSASALAIGGGAELTTTNQTGTGSLVLTNAPTLTGATLSGATLSGATLTNPVITNPNITGLSLTSADIGAATATSLSIGGGSALTTTNRTGTGNLVLATSPTLTGATLTNPIINGASLASAHIGAATGLSLALGNGTPLTTTNRTGTGLLAMSNSPAFVTPSLGAATGLSLALGGGPPLSTTNQTGTGSLVLANAPTLTGATLTNPTISGASLTNASLVTPNLGAATGLSLALGGGTPLTTTKQTGSGNLVLATSPILTTPNIGAATGLSLILGNGTPLLTTNQTGTGSLVLSSAPTLTGATLAGATLTSPAITGATLTNAIFVTPNIGAATGLSLALGGGSPLLTTNQTGTGNLVLANSPTLNSPIFTTPNIGAATGLSLALGAGTPLTTTSQTGTGSLVLANAPTLTGATLTNPTISGATLSGASLVTPSIGAATGLSLALGGGTPLTTTNQTGTGSLALSVSPTLVNATLNSPVISNATITGAALSGVTLTNPDIGAAAGSSLALGGGMPLTTTNRTGTGLLAMSNSPAFVTPSLGAAQATSLAVGGGEPLTTSAQTGTGPLVLSASPTIASPLISAPTISGRVGRTVVALAHGAADPSVAAGDVFQVSNPQLTSISNFSDGAEGQLIFLVFSDSNTTVLDGPDIRLRGDFNSKPDAVLIMLRVGSAWFEISRSIDTKPSAPPKLDRAQPLSKTRP